MFAHLLRRVAQCFFVILSAFTLCFLILFALPSNPIEIMLRSGDGPPPDPATVAELVRQSGFDKPLWQQYLTQLGDFATGDFGTSIQEGRPVAGMILSALPETLRLSAVALVFSVVLGASIAILATYLRFDPAKRLLMCIPPLGVSVPGFWVGLMLLQIVSFKLRLLPAFGNAGWQSLILPGITLAIPNAAILAQVFAKSIENVLAQPFIVSVRSRGIPRFRIYLRDVIRNASIPAVTLLGVIMGNLLSGSVVAETVFSRNGIGRLIQKAVLFQDIPVLNALVIVTATVYALANLAVDLVYPLLDYRIGAPRRAQSQTR